MKRHILTLGLAIAVTMPGYAQLFAVAKDKKLGYIDINGNLVVPAQYDRLNNDELPDMSEDRIVYATKWKYGLLDEKGNVVLAPKYDKIRGYRNGYARVELAKPGTMSGLSNLVGYIDKQGTEVVPPMYVLPFFTSTGLNDGQVAVDNREAEIEYYVAMTGAPTVPGRFHTAKDFRHGMAPVQPEKDGLYGFINKSGAWVIEPKYSYAEPFDQAGFAVVTMPDKTWGWIDKNGKTVASGLTYSKTGFLSNGFTDGMMLVKKDNKYGYLDVTGKMAVPLQYDYSATSFNDGLAVVNNGCSITKDKYGFETISGGTWMIIDKKGKVQKELTGYESIGGFSEGIAVMKKDGKYGYIDTKGHEVVPPQWEERPDRFYKGLGRFTMPGQYSFSAQKPFGYVNAQGKIVWEAQM